MLPLTIEMLLGRARPQMTALARALGAKRDDLPKRLTDLGGGRRRLSELGAERDGIDEVVKAILARSELRQTPDVPGEAEIRKLIERAW
jgi:alcohol dehydrogenase class IV